MEIFRLVKTLEELIFEFSFWLISYPKNILKITFQPGWVSRYVTNELAKDEHERFNEYMSPALFYAISIVIVVVPRYETLASIYQSGKSAYFSRLLLGSTETLVITVAIVLAVCPLAYAWVVSIGSRSKISRSSFRAPLLSQYFIAGPFILGFSFSIDLAHSQLALVTGMAALIWFCVAEWLFFRNFLGVSKVKAGLLVLAGFGAWYLVNLAWFILLGLSLLARTAI